MVCWKQDNVEWYSVVLGRLCVNGEHGQLDDSKVPLTHSCVMDNSAYLLTAINWAVHFDTKMLLYSLTKGFHYPHDI